MTGAPKPHGFPRDSKRLWDKEARSAGGKGADGKFLATSSPWENVGCHFFFFGGVVVLYKPGGLL